MKKQKKKNKYVKTGFFYSVGRNILWHFAAFILFIIALFCFPFKVEGRKKLKALKDRGFVITVNHCNIFDSLIAMFSIYPRKLRIATLKSNLKIFIAGGIIHLAGGVGLPNNSAGLKTMTEELAQALRDGEIALYMPEAHLIHHCPYLRDFKKGAFLLAKTAGVDVVPMAYKYRLNCFKAIRYTLMIGDPIKTDNLTVDEIKNAAFETMKEYTKGNAEVFYKSRFYKKLKRKNKLKEYEQFNNPYEEEKAAAEAADSAALQEVALTADQNYILRGGNG